MGLVFSDDASCVHGHGGVNFVIATAELPQKNGSRKKAQEAARGLDSGATARSRH